MCDSARAASWRVFVLGLHFSTGALAQAPGPGFTLCVAPTAPECIDTARSPAEKKSCDEAVNAYVRTVFQYRACLEAETQRAILQSNDALDRWRCRRPGAQCPGGANDKEPQ